MAIVFTFLISLLLLLYVYGFNTITYQYKNRISSRLTSSSSISSSSSIPSSSSPSSSLSTKKSTLFKLYAKIEEVSDDTRIADIVTLLKNVIDPDSGSDIINGGFCDTNSITTNANGDVELTINAEKLGSSANDIIELCKKQLRALLWTKNIIVNTEEKRVQDSAVGLPNGNAGQKMTKPAGMAKVKNVIAVSSCKGGVGKSTVSVNLAYTLSMAGAKVGILDADIYGPSLPTMTKPVSTEVVYANNQIQPLEYEGVKLMSMGFINKGASIMRGPMVNQILNQFVTLCNWGELDYLVVDMPPGTGDIQLTLAQIVDISAAVIVTTPQRLSFVDVVKGIDLFDTVNVPCVAVVENMAEYDTYSFPPEFFEKLGEKVTSVASAATAFNPDPSQAFSAVTDVIKQSIEAQKLPKRVFGEGHTQRLRDMWGLDNIVSLPLLEDVSKCGDTGLPYVKAYPKSVVSTTMIGLANGVINEVKRLSKETEIPSFSFDSVLGTVQFKGNQISPFELRCDCRCATCIEELTGKKLLNPDTVPKNVKPLNMAPIGRYAMSFDWSDGHRSLYPFRQVASLVEKMKK